MKGFLSLVPILYFLGVSPLFLYACRTLFMCNLLVVFILQQISRGDTSRQRQRWSDGFHTSSQLLHTLPCFLSERVPDLEVKG